ncbi:translational elongation factor EF-1 alpha [Lobosporangium transversale]|uniref:p-loop containing nucleoside triphosphate hydrolase protein n=1 Tax=Lobosporangium transversale TaxID=64571 RepID=A0A1Y2H3G1_9FUNG|nr:P-loop containing nucleoside triphosphate hydrolase protein [Lobosporangium transversale]KAF9916658.1 translational elongation factor EF-1 alpha [Lobosporangium transversale]ORZ27612.1 P-loop containing nucleoside triphosphate hydrolase protein [Lobosporangium transversale]|eukprot:XP_021885315.1 P-loop containing nucleoside triphosphate hydrolase protein [Lobosporangium transversale]
MSADTKTLNDLIKATQDQTTSEARKEQAEKVAEEVKNLGIIKAFHDGNLIKTVTTLLENKKQAPFREAAYYILASVSKTVGQAGEPYLIPLVPKVLDGYADKVTSVRDAADEASKAIMALPSRYAVKLLLPVLFASIENGRWQSQVGSLQLLAGLSKSSPKQISKCLSEIVPVLSASMWSTRPEVRAEATKTTTACFEVVGNPDLISSIPYLVGCINRPEEVPECIHQLASTTFVTTVEAPTLAIMTPLLIRGLAERTPSIQRQTAVIIDNMCKLVENPAHAHQFLPKLLPGLDRLIEIGASPELRSVAERARATLIRVGGGEKAQEESILNIAYEIKPNEVLETLKKTIGSSIKVDDFVQTSLSYSATLCSELITSRDFESDAWDASITPYLLTFISKDEAKRIATSVHKFYVDYDAKNALSNAAVADVEEGELLCDCEFSLAYGGMILLNKTRLNLRRGQRYGLCGPNGVGKSTLMRAIADGQLEGFPPADELRTVFVEHNLQAEEADLPVVEFMFADPKLSDIPHEEVVSRLSSVGFTPAMQQQAVGSLSGGWKMKLELARAMLMNADILLLDEPTNHLDVHNVAWLESYLTSLTNVTSMIVSHDSSFLDNVCTGIIHYESRKLKKYRGNLSKFVEQYPDAKSYYELKSSLITFKLPEPGFLDGVKSKDKALLKFINISFTYPGNTTPTIRNMSAQVSLNSRVAVVGPNGAGKSTLIKVLTGETIPQVGEVTKHPNLRVAYVAQHAFHHVEQHLTKTPNEYIRWRYQFGEDRELAAKASRQISPEEEAQMKKVIQWEINGKMEKLQIDDLYGRRKAKRSFEYEVQWVGRTYDDNAWISREKLEEWGFEKLLQSFDDKEAARAGAWTRSLTAVEVEKHLGDLGLPAEFATHNHIKGLSGGQKVKVVLAAAMWLNPHILVLDEPTNYLDRDSLGALTEALREFGGGVVIISHHRDFTEAICTETWSINAGELTVTGNNYTQRVESKIVQKEAETKIDAFGNVEKVKSTRKLSRKELKDKQKRRAAAKARGEEVSDSEDDL